MENGGAGVREILGRPRRDRQLQRMVDALDSDRIEKVDRGAWLVMPNPDRVDASLIEDALQTTLAGNHTGWKLVRVAAAFLGTATAGCRCMTPRNRS